MSFGIDPSVNFGPTPPKKADASSKGCLIVAGVVIGLPVLLFLSIFVIGVFFGDESNDDEAQAIVACEREVRDNLKAPSTADFRSFAAKSGGAWKVSGTVDAENSFGAKIRNTFSCSVGISGDSATATITSWQ